MPSRERVPILASSARHQTVQVGEGLEVRSTEVAGPFDESVM
jgi:hypothetical protein